jgi:hypothetical protein
MGSLSATPVDRPLADDPGRCDQRARRHSDHEPRDIAHRHQCLATDARPELASGNDPGLVSGGGTMRIIRSTSESQRSKTRATGARLVFAIATSRSRSPRSAKGRERVILIE